MPNSLPIVEKFHSLQGEGAHVGKSAYFIRLAKCEVGCAWCDTKESWNESLYPHESIQSISEHVFKAQIEGADFTVITGGEPLHHNLDMLCKRIRNITASGNIRQIPIHIETSGINELSGKPDWITLSPKRHFPPKQDLLAVCQELKVIIHCKEDLIFAEQMATQTAQNLSINPLLFLQAGWNNEEGKILAYEYVKANPQWRLSMQTHKWLKIL